MFSRKIRTKTTWSVFSKRYIYKYSESAVNKGSETFSTTEKPKTSGEILKEAENILNLAQERLQQITRYCLEKGYKTQDHMPLDLREAYRGMSEVIEKLDQIIVREKQNLTNPDNNNTLTEETLRVLKSAIIDHTKTLGPSKNFERASEENFTSLRYGYASEGKPIYEVVDTGPGFIENKRGELEKRMVFEAEGVVVHINIPATINPSKPIEFQPYLNADGNNLDRTLGYSSFKKKHWHDQEIGPQNALMRDLGKENLVYAVIRPTQADNWEKIKGNPEALRQVYAKIEKQFQILYPQSKFDTITLSGHSGGGVTTNSCVDKGLLEDKRINKIMGFDMAMYYSASVYIQWALNNPNAIFCHVGGNTLNQLNNEYMMVLMDKELKQRGLPLGKKTQKNGIVFYTALNGRFQLINIQRGKGKGGEMHTMTVVDGYRYASALGDKKLEENPECSFFINQIEAYGIPDKNNLGFKLKKYSVDKL